MALWAAAVLCFVFGSAGCWPGTPDEPAAVPDRGAGPGGCLGASTGYSHEMVEAVKGMMEDPGSFRHGFTVATPAVGGKGRFILLMGFEGRAGAGVPVKALAEAELRTRPCRLFGTPREVKFLNR